MGPDQREAYVKIALAMWEPAFPGEKKPKLAVWFAGEPEAGLSGFHTKEDRDAFHSGTTDGPFLRRVTGRTFIQMPYRDARQGEKAEL